MRTPDTLTRENRDAAPKRDALSLYAWVLDSSIPLPGGFRIGLDGLIGLIPVVGDFLAALLSGGIVVHAFREGVSLPVITRMLGNILLELIIGAIPVAGDLFDFAFRANERNVKLFKDFNERPQRVRRRSQWIVVAIALGFLLAIVAIASLLWTVLGMVLTAFA